MNKIIAFLGAAAAAIIALLTMRGKQLKAERNQAQQRADIAEQVADYHEKQDAALAALAEKQREEIINAQNDIKNGRRDQLDTDW